MNTKVAEEIKGLFQRTHNKIDFITIINSIQHNKTREVIEAHKKGQFDKSVDAIKLTK